MAKDIVEQILEQKKNFNSSYAQINDPIKEKRSVFSAFLDEPMRRALSGINNRVVTAPEFQLGTAGPNPAGVAINAAFSYTVDGALVSGTANTNVAFTKALGTQGTASYCKYLIAGDQNGVITIIKGNESTAGTAGTYYGTVSPVPGAFMPELPQQNCALGYIEIQTGALHFTSGVGGITTGVTSCNIYNLRCMPIYEP
jgi:hypothetical protein